MAVKKVVFAPTVAGPRVYPHVNEIKEFPAQQSTRLAWDRIQDLHDSFTAIQTTLKTLIDSHNTLQTTLTTVSKNADQALALSQKTTGDGGTIVGGATGGSGSVGGAGGTGNTGGSSSGGGSSGGGAGGGTGSPSSAVTIDGLSVIINGGSPDVSGWQRTTHLDAIDVGSVTVTFGKQSGPGRWPDVPFGNTGGSLQYTLWIFESHGGQWYASGIIQFWFGRGSGGNNISCNNEMAKNWTYDGRWGPMAGYQPQPGEVIGFMVTAGNQRGTDDHLVAERSNIVFIKMPTCGGPTTFPPYSSET